MAATLEGANKDFANSVSSLLKDTGATLTSGYRSNAEQQSLYNAALAKYGSEQEARKWAAKPGGSNHEHGIAADIGNYQNITDAQLAKYGLYRPMSWEPWHVEPIGSRSKGGKDAYTTPPVDTAVQTTMDQLREAINALGIGEQASSVGETGTGVGEQNTGVGDAIDSVPTLTTPAATGPVAGNNTVTATKTTGNAQGGGDINSLMAAIAAKESGGNYNARNKDSGAFGKYQIMPANWPSWSKKAGLPANAPQTPENQELVARYKLGQYLDKYGVEGAAQAWYGGEGSVGKTARSGGAGYPTVGQYGSDIASKVK